MCQVTRALGERKDLCVLAVDERMSAARPGLCARPVETSLACLKQQRLRSWS